MPWRIKGVDDRKVLHLLGHRNLDDRRSIHLLVDTVKSCMHLYVGPPKTDPDDCPIYVRLVIKSPGEAADCGTGVYGEPGERFYAYVFRHDVVSLQDVSVVMNVLESLGDRNVHVARKLHAVASSQASARLEDG